MGLERTEPEARSAPGPKRFDVVFKFGDMREVEARRLRSGDAAEPEAKTEGSNVTEAFGLKPGEKGSAWERLLSS